MVEEGRKLTIKSVKTTVITFRIIVKVNISIVKSILVAIKSLIGLKSSFGVFAILIIIVICLIALLLCSSFGIFFSNEGSSASMSSVISNINLDVYNKIENNKRLYSYDDYVINSSYSNIKEVIAIYSVKYSDLNSIPFYLNDDNISKIKIVFWEANTIQYKINRECDDKLICKNILYINIVSKDLNELIEIYNLDNKQINQVMELIDVKNDELWNSLIYGNNTGDWINWKQKGEPWSNIKIGNSNKSIGDIGCLVTAIAALIEKSGVYNPIQPFNPGTFVEALNNVDGFTDRGGLYWSSVSKVVPNFEYVGSVSLVDKTKEDKIRLISNLLSKGYYLVVEVKTANDNQHWVAINYFEGNNIYMIDPGSNSNLLWEKYDYNNTSLIKYFNVK